MYFLKHDRNGSILYQNATQIIELTIYDSHTGWGEAMFRPFCYNARVFHNIKI